MADIISHLENLRNFKKHNDSPTSAPITRATTSLLVAVANLCEMWYDMFIVSQMYSKHSLAKSYISDAATCQN
jgi:hypothetical protein